MLRFFLVTLFSFLLATSFAKSNDSSEGDTDKKQSSVSSGDSLGIATWQVISRHDSKLSVPGAEDKILVNRGFIALDNPNVYAEAIVFSNGTITYKRDANYSDIPIDKNIKQRKKQLRDLLKSKELKALGIKKLTDFQHTEFSGSDDGENYLLTLAKGESAKAQCILFYKALTRGSRSPVAQRATGVFCFPQKQLELYKENYEMVSVLAQKLAFDDGAYAQAATLAGLTQEVHEYWSSQDQKPPIITLEKAVFNDHEIFISGKAQDDSKIDFIKVNGERLADNDFTRSVTSDGSFNIYVKSSRSFNKASITIGDQYGNSQTKQVTQKVSVVPSNHSPIFFKKHESSKTYAVLVAVSSYPNIGDLKVLISPPNDIDLIKKTLTNTIGLPDDPKYIHMMKNPTKMDFIDKLNELRSVMSYGDRLLVYFSGHGTVYKDETTQKDYGYWLFTNTTEDPKTWLSNQEATNLLSGFSDGGVMLIADSCFSGNFIAKRFYALSDIDFKNSKEAKTIFVAAGNNPVPDTVDGTHSAFALAVARALPASMKQARSQGELSIPGMFIYTNTSNILKDEGQASPRYGSFMGSSSADILLK